MTMKSVLMNVLVACVIGTSGTAFADPIPQGWQALNMKPVGFLDYHDRYSGKLTIKQSEGRWYLYQAYNKTISL